MLLVLAVRVQAGSQEAGAPGQRGSAHEHGVSELNVAVIGDVIEVSLMSPSINLVGFERAASSKAEIEAVASLKKTLESADSLINFGAAKCRNISATVDVGSLLDRDEAGDVHSHSQSHDHGERHEEKHYDVSAIYQFQCAAAAKIAFLKVDLFDAFAGIQEVNVLWLTEIRQGRKVTSAKDRKVVFE